MHALLAKRLTSVYGFSPVFQVPGCIRCLHKYSKQRERWTSRPELAMAESVPWTRRHLLGLEELSLQEITTILDTAENFVESSQRQRRKRAHLANKVVVNLF